MNITIFDKYNITSDNLQYIVSTQKKSDKSGKEYSGNYKYCTTLRSALLEIREQEARNNRCKTLDGYIKHLNKIDKELKALLDKNFK